MTDKLFTQYGFKATGGTANRTMPDRLADEKNVMDYGATGNGSTNDTAAVQAAVDAAIADGTGVYFPVGTYIVTDSGSGSAIIIDDDVDFGFYMRGAAGGGSTLQSSNCSGYIVDRSLATPNNTIGPRVFENLGFTNATVSPNLGGGLRIGSTTGVIVRGCRFSCAGTGMTTEDEPGVSSQNILVDTCNFVAATSAIDSVGLVMGGSGSVTCCEFNGIWDAQIIYGSGISFNSNRCERCDTAFKLGIDSDGTDQGLTGFSLTCQEMEGVVNFIDFIGTVTGFFIGPVGCLGHDIGNSGLQGHTENSQYGIRIRANKAYFGEILACGTSQHFDVGAIYMEDYIAPKRSYVTFSNCSPIVTAGSGVAWRIPSTSAWPLFIACSAIDASVGPPYGTRYLYSGLPTGGDVAEGDEYDISDGNTGTIGATVTAGGGANRIRVRWNGSAWICLPG